MQWLKIVQCNGRQQELHATRQKAHFCLSNCDSDFCSFSCRSLCLADNYNNTHHHYHHHHGQAPGWSVAVSTSCLHHPWSWACRHAEFSPWLSGWRSASRVRSQVWRGRPGRRFQSLAIPWINNITLSKLWQQQRAGLWHARQNICTAKNHTMTMSKVFLRYLWVISQNNGKWILKQNPVAVEIVNKFTQKTITTTTRV